MKKTIILTALVALMGSVMATSFNWVATVVSFDGTKVKNSTNLNGYLIYLGSNASLESSYSWEDVDTMVSSASATKTAASVMSKFSGVSTYQDATNNGDTYAMLLTWNDGDDLYYALSSKTYTVSGISDGIENLEDFDATAGFNGYATDKSGASALTTGAGWQKATPVPEPATAALALAGLALLIRRRRV